MRPRIIAAFMAAIFALPVFAVQPDEILTDPTLEARARELSKGLRCLVCRNESIDESNAQLARDLRLLLRERLVAGDTDEEAIDFIVARYGEYVLLSPKASGSTLILWIAGPVLLILAGGVATMYVRGRRSDEPRVALSDEEKSRLAAILEE